MTKREEYLINNDLTIASVSQDTVSDKKNQTKRLISSAEWELIRTLREYQAAHPLCKRRAG